jgi:hypothetical protein
MLLCDTGVLLAAGNIKDQAHRACVSAQILPQRPGVRDLGHPRQTAWSTCTAGRISAGTSCGPGTRTPPSWLPRDGAVIGIDLADEKQAIGVIDHDVRVLARKTVKVKAFRLGEALDWAVAQARVKASRPAISARTDGAGPGPGWLALRHPGGQQRSGHGQSPLSAARHRAGGAPPPR